MGFLILLTVGAALGWLSFIVLKESGRRAVQLDMISGAAGSIGAGLVLSANPLIDQLSANTFLYGCLAAIAAIACSQLIRRMLINH